VRQGLIAALVSVTAAGDACEASLLGRLIDEFDLQPWPDIEGRLDQLDATYRAKFVWERPQLAPRDRSLITVASLLTSGSTEQLTFHLAKARDNGLTETELVEAITHLAFYAGWPKAMSAMTVAKKTFRGDN
jgi:4-carboxymuconolactone decarboxylase